MGKSWNINPILRVSTVSTNKTRGAGIDLARPSKCQKKMGKVMTRIKIMGHNKFVLRVLGGSRYLSFYPSIHLTYTAG